MKLLASLWCEQNHVTVAGFSVGYGKGVNKNAELYVVFRTLGNAHEGKYQFGSHARWPDKCGQM